MNNSDNKRQNKIVSEMFYSSLSVMIISTITSAAGMLVDGILTGSFLGVTAMTAYGLASPVFIVIMALMGILTSGGQNRCANYLSRGENDRLNRTFSTLCNSTAALGIVFLLMLFVFMPGILGLLGASPLDAELYSETKGYYIGIVSGIPGIMLVGILQPIVQLDGDPKRVVRSVIIMTIANISGDLLNVFLIHGGMLGMGLATSISEYIALIILCLHFDSRKNQIKYALSSFDIREFGNMMKIGMPTANARACTTIRQIALNKIILALGVSEGVAALSSLYSAETVFRTLGIGVGFATLLLSSVFFSEHDEKSLQRLLAVALKTILIGGTIIGLLILILAHPIASLMLKSDAAALSLSATLFRIYAICVPLNGINYLFTLYLQGIGKIGKSNIVCTLNGLVYVVASALILSRIQGVTGVYLALPVGEALTLITIFILAIAEKKRLPQNISDLDFVKIKENDRVFTMDILSGDDVVRASKEVTDFVTEACSDKHKATLLGVFVEELGVNIFKFNSDRPDISVDLRASVTDDEVILRLRDNGVNFDTVKWYEVHNTNHGTEEGGKVNPDGGLGIRIVMEAAGSVEYYYSFKMNNIIVKM